MRLHVPLAVAFVGQCVPPDPLGPAERYRDALLESIATTMMTSIVADAPAGLGLEPGPVRVHVLTGEELAAICPTWGTPEEPCEPLVDPDGPHGAMAFGAIWLFPDRMDASPYAVLSHEVAHALHSPWPECATWANDCGLAASAVREGHAMYAQLLLTGKAARRSDVPPLEEVDLSGAATPPRAAYPLGDRFFHWLQYNGLLSSLTVERLPDTTTELLHPELWLAGWEPSLPCAEGNPVGEAEIQRELGPFVGWPAARAAAAGWDGDCVMADERPWISRWESAADAEEFGAAMQVRYGPPWMVDVGCAGVECVVSRAR